MTQDLTPDDIADYMDRMYDPDDRDSGNIQNIADYQDGGTICEGSEGKQFEHDVQAVISMISGIQNKIITDDKDYYLDVITAAFNRVIGESKNDTCNDNTAKSIGATKRVRKGPKQATTSPKGTGS